MKLALGTAQFGLDYGISNRGGRTPPGQVQRILELAAGAGVTLLDTAPGYGNSEEVLGQLLPPQHGFSILTKIRPLRTAAVTEADAESIRHAFAMSLEKLRQKQVYGVLIHHCQDLLVDGGERVLQVLKDCQSAGQVGKIGISIYTAQELDAVLERFPIDIVQLPLSVFDQRLLQSGHLARLQARGIEVHARSVFLQGLMLMDQRALPEGMQHYASQIAEFRTFAEQANCLPAHAALKFVHSLQDVDAMIVGVNSASQLEELLKYEDCTVDCSAMRRLAQNDPLLLNPSQWRR